jgi:transposase
MSRTLRRLGITLKKVLRASERDEEARAAWWAETQTLDPTRFVFVDESGTNISLKPRYGCAPRGQRVVGVVPRNHGPNVTLFAAMGADGITAAMTMTGPADGEVWPLFARLILVPSLRPGQIVIWDNLGVHKNRAVRELIAATGCEVRFLPPYSPDFNPIEQAFGKLKTSLRRANARARPALEDAIAAGLAAITPHDAQAWFRHCGYVLPEQLV